MANHHARIKIKAINTNGNRAIKIRGPIIRQINVSVNNRKIEVIKRIDYVNKLSSISNSFSYFIFKLSCIFMIKLLN